MNIEIKVARREKISVVCATLLACTVFSFPAWGSNGKGDDVDATNAAIATNSPPLLAEVMGMPKAARNAKLLAVSNDGFKEYKYSATGDLRTYTSGSDITLYFDVTEQFTKIESASISLMAYDVDYPVDTENDVTSFNGTPLGWRLQGGNNSWHANNNIPVPVKLIKIPDENNATGHNVFFVAVDVGNEGWVTCISEATLTIKGKVGLDVNASDGTETGGILVTWSAVSGVSSYHITRRAVKGGQEKDLGTVNGTEYMDEDEELVPNEEYNYIVRAVTSSSSTRGLLGASADGIEGSDKGYYDDNPPLITAMEVAPLFLENNGPYNVKLTWNNYDEEKFAVKEVRFTFTAVEGGKNAKEAKATWSSLEGKSRAELSDETDLSKHGLSFGDAAHGKYKVKIEWTGWDKKKKKTFTEYKEKGASFFSKKKKLELELDEGCKVYFEKWGGGSGSDHNWWKYWKDDGAIDSHADIFDHRCVIPSSDNQQLGEEGTMVTAGQFQATGGEWRHWGGYDLTLGSVKYYVPKFSKYSFANSNLLVGDAAAATSRSILAGDNTPVGTDAQGVQALGVVIAHELSHKRTKEDLYNGRYFLDDGVGFLDINLDFIQQWLNKTTAELNDGSVVMTAEQRKKLETICSGLVPYVEEVQIARLHPGWIASDVDGDGVRDEREGEPKWNLKCNKDDSDSHGIANATTPGIDTPDDKKSDFSDYASYGDNEFIARSEEKDGLGYANVDKDWAYPGNKIATGYMGRSSDGWKSVEPSETARLQKVDGGASGASAQVAGRRLILSATEGSLDLRQYGAILSANWTSESEDCSDTLEIIGAEVGNASGDGGNGFNELSFTLNVSNRMERSGYFSFTGYLVDDEGKGVAKAYAGATLEPGLGQVTLRFAGQYIYSSHRNGYALKLVEVANADTDILTGAGAKNDLATTTRAYSYNEFAHDEVEIGTGISETLDGRDLKVTVPLELDGTGEYVAEATILDMGGNFVAATKTSFAAGDQSIVLSFSGDDIYASAREGKFRIYSIIVKDASGVTVKRVWDAYETAEYARGQFAPGELPVVVDSSSFSFAATYLADGVTVDALAMSFTATNSCAEALDYRIEANVTGTNGIFAAACSTYMTLETGENVISLKIDSARLKANGVYGPYSVRDVLLVPTGDMGNTERFFPVADAVAVPMEDLADAVFTVGEARVLMSETEDYLCAITVPVTVGRPVTLTLSVMLVDSVGKIVAMGTSVRQYDAACNDSMEYRFSIDQIQAAELKGPYTIRFAAISCDIDGVSPVRVKVPEEGESIERQYTRYVDCNASGGQADGYSWDTAFRSIQDAVDAADDGDVILVADGTYTPFDTRNKAIEIRSVNGYEYTFIDGGGTNRCATLGYDESQTNTVLVGFALLNGDASTSNVLVLWDCGGAVCCGTIRNCWIEGNTASKGGGAYYGVLENCVIAGNSATTYGGASYYGKRVNCTIVGNTASYDGGGTCYGESYNTIAVGNSQARYSYSEPIENNYYGGTFAYCLTTPSVSGNGNIAGDAGFRDHAKANYALRRSSICVNSGSAVYMSQGVDIAGNLRVSGDAVDIGAFELKYSEYTSGLCDFVLDEVRGDEGGSVQISIFGGLTNQSCSVQLYLTYNTATAADLDLAKGTVDGVAPKGGLKFPLTVSWTAGETGAKTVEIPIKSDKTVEDNETFTLQLANPVGMILGEYRTCTITIKDQNTAVSLADSILNHTLKPTSKGDGKWIPVEAAFDDPSDTNYFTYAVSPLMKSGQQSSLALASVKGTGTLCFSLKFIGEDKGSTLSKLYVFDGAEELGWLSTYEYGDEWQDWSLAVKNNSSHNLSFKFVQGDNSTVQAKLTDVCWIPDKTFYQGLLLLKPEPACGGYTLGGGIFPKTANMKIEAKPRPGWTFDGWYDSSGSLWGKKIKTTVEFLNTTSNGGAMLVAKFSKIPYVRALADPADGGKVSGSGLCAAGKKVTLKASANKNFTFKGWYASLPGDPNSVDMAKCVATTASLVIDRSAKPAANSKTSTTIAGITADVTYFAIFEGDPRVTVMVEPNDAAGKITGIGRYAPNKKVSLKATANKGYVFSGWYDGESLVSQAASYAFTMPDEDVALAAKFITSAEDAASVSLCVDALGGELEQGATVYVTNHCGVALKWSIAANALSQPTVAVSGLPAGLKFTAKDIVDKKTKQVAISANTVYGVPTAESKPDAKTGVRKPSAVKVTVTTAGKSKVVYPVEMTILPLPDWAVGTFDGGGDHGQVSISVAKTGKLSGKYLSEGLTWSLAADSFDSIDDSGDVYRATLVGKSGKLSITNEIGVARDDMGGFVESLDYIAFQNNWKLEPWKTVGKPFAKAAALEYEDVAAHGVITLKFASSGAVAANGSFAVGVDEKTGKEIVYSASGSAVLAPRTEIDENGAFEGVVFVYFPPKAGEFDGYVRYLAIRWTGEAWTVVP